MVRLLLSCGADANIQDNQGTTALMFASERGYTHIARLLLERSQCDLTLTDKVILQEIRSTTFEKVLQYTWTFRIIINVYCISDCVPLGHSLQTNLSDGCKNKKMKKVKKKKKFSQWTERLNDSKLTWAYVCPPTLWPKKQHPARVEVLSSFVTGNRLKGILYLVIMAPLVVIIPNESHSFLIHDNSLPLNWFSEVHRIHTMTPTAFLLWNPVIFVYKMAYLLLYPHNWTQKGA